MVVLSREPTAPDVASTKDSIFQDSIKIPMNLTLQQLKIEWNELGH